MTLPQKLKQLWQESKQKKTSSDISQEAVQENKEEPIPNTPPPQYTERSSQDRNEDALSDRNNPYPVLTKYAKQVGPIRGAKFHWVLVDIVAATFSTDTFSTDVGSLKTVMVKTDPAWAPIMAFDSSSIWDKEGRTLVAETCALVQNLEREMARNRWLLIHPRDKYLVEKMVLDPVRIYRMNLDFVLEVLGRFKRGQDCCRPESTLLDHWKTSPHTTDLGDAIASHSLLLENFRLREEVRLVLEDYVPAFQKRKGLKELCTSKELQEESLVPGRTCGWPLSDGYMDLARGLRALKTSRVIRDPYESSRTRLREKRNIVSPERVL
ncbi:hypothetical protein P171DRAFT_489175 [Karstenula rhodostoma CBS 690.94]|uniref:Uncharacterized protein n=1 Tax=Karstenula rhodostoma CBS 690.94 TaxID=1392251 RepID=A0A9P4PC38_9PLEO|nr:hypothetical protein P171DRAFT_489175 [Karstenula rhodostoma CBS 690.94]